VSRLWVKFSNRYLTCADERAASRNRLTAINPEMFFTT
jgi:hypothetical protein